MPTSEDEVSDTREKIANDLKTWQEKFAKAAGKGTEELEVRVREITDRQIDNQVHKVGEALVVQLEETTNTEYAKLKKQINKVVKSLSEESSKEELLKAEEDVAKSVRTSGQAVKTKAQTLRTWKQRFDNETESLVLAASDSILEVIDNIRDLGLQKVGMKWAEIEGVTYDDWSNYHAVKKTFDKWRNEVEAVAKDHPGLLNARSAADEVEAKGMGIAEDAAKELTRLKQVASWKIQAGDDSDDFSTKILPAKAAIVGGKIMKGASSVTEAALGTSQGTIDSVISQASQQIMDAASGVSSQVVGTQPGFVEQAASKASEILGGSSLSSGSIQSVATKISAAVVGTPQPKVESVVSAASKKVDQAFNGVSQAIKGTPAPVYKSVASEVSRSATSVSSAVPEVISPSSASVLESAESVESSVRESASSEASQASRKVFGGAMAQEVNERVPVLDDFVNEDEDSSYSEQMQSIVSKAGDKYADVTKAVVEALGLSSTYTQGSVESATSLAGEQYNSALAAASKALYGEEPGMGEQVASAASTKYFDAVSA